MRLQLIALCCATAFLVAAAPAAADSIVFIRSSNVWLANADGTGQYQVTLDGTPSAPYESPSEADDGTILAVRQPPGQRNQLFRMTQSGGLLNAPFNTPAPGPAGALDAKISPNGQLVAYWFVTAVNDPICAFCIQAASQALLSRSDRFTNPVEVGTPNTGIRPSWINNTTVLLSNSNATQWTYTLGAPEGVEWFETNQVGFGSDIKLFDDSEVAPNGSRLVIVRGDNGETLFVFPMTALPPTVPSNPVCFYEHPTGKFFSPTWSTSGDRLYWQEGDGVWSAPIATPLTASACGTPVLLVAGASEPDASPAANAPGPRPACANPGNPAVCPQPPCGGSGPTCPQPPCGSAGAAACPPKTDTANRVLLGCGTRKLVLSNVAQRNGRVALSGAAATSFAGQKVSLLFNGRQKVATATVGANGAFVATAPLPARRLRSSNSSRYTAVLGSQRSADLKLVRRLNVTSIKRSGANVTLSGRIATPLAKPTAPVTVTQQVDCGPTKTLKAFKPSASGSFSVSFTAAAGSGAIYRLKTRVRSSTHSRATSLTASLPVPVAL